MNLNTHNKNLIVLAAGGTGGHLFPAEALAYELSKRGYKLVLLTDKRARSYSGILGSLDTHIVYSRSSGNIKSLALFNSAAMTLFRVFSAHQILKNLSPSLVIGFGGYPSLPTVLAAQLGKVNSIIHEQNAILGRANRILAPLSSVIATSFPETYRVKSSKNNVFHTGNPVRKEIKDLESSPYKPPKPSDTIKILVTGGSQGASSIDKVIPRAFAELPHKFSKRIFLSQQCRSENLSNAKRILSSSPIKSEIKPFFKNIASRIADSHLVIARSGASTLAELSVIGRPSILIPYPHATDQHQEKNAFQFKSEGAAEIINQKDLQTEVITKKITRLLENSQKLDHMAKKAKKFARPQAAHALADLAEMTIHDSHNKADKRIVKAREMQ